MAATAKRRLLRHGDRVVRQGVNAKVVDVHDDKMHVSVLIDGADQLTRWSVDDVERIL